MAYSFEADETIPDGIKRIMQELIDDILTGLKKADDEAIHDSRKAFKQLRALLRLWCSEMDEPLYQQRKNFYRDLALKLAPLRDAFVLIEALDKVMEGVETPEILENGQKLRKDLMKEYKQIRRDLLKEGGVVENVLHEVQAHNIEDWDFPRDSFKSLKTGFLKGYERGQKLLQLAYKEKTEENFHEWRKAVKILWYHSRLLEKAYPKKLSAYVDELKKLSELLGDANDFAILETYLVEKNQTALIPFVQEKRKALLKRAKPLGKALYKAQGDKLTGKIRLRWKKWRLSSA